MKQWKMRKDGQTIEDENGHMIGSFWAVPGKDHLPSILKAPEMEAEIERLKLINADLLEACKKALNGFNTLTTGEFGLGRDKPIRKCLKQAITKAEGKVEIRNNFDPNEGREC